MASGNESNGTVSKSIGRLDFKELCQRVPLLLPDFGQVEVFPYISAGAMAAANRAKAESSILGAILDASLEVREGITQSLTNLDWVAVGLHFAKAIEADDEFSRLVAAGASPHDAFATSLKSSATWKDDQKSREEFRAYVAAQIEPSMKIAETYQRSIQSILVAAQIPKIDLQLSKIQLLQFDQLNDTVRQLTSLAQVALPRIELLPKQFHLFDGIREQVASISAIRTEQLATIRSFENLVARPTLL